VGGDEGGVSKVSYLSDSESFLILQSFYSKKYCASHNVKIKTPRFAPQTIDFYYSSRVFLIESPLL